MKSEAFSININVILVCDFRPLVFIYCICTNRVIPNISIGNSKLLIKAFLNKVIFAYF